MGEPKGTGEKPGGGDPPVAPQETKVSQSNTKTPGAWFVALTPKGKTQRELTNLLADFKGASALHGWAEHKHHTGKSIELTEADYLAALKGATSGTGKAGIHQPALSPYRGKGL